jgi:hypothetical protein
MDFWQYSYAVDKGLTFFSNHFYKTGNSCMQGWTRAVKLFDDSILACGYDDSCLRAVKSKYWLSQLSSLYDFTSTVTGGFASTVQYSPKSTMLGNLTMLEVVCAGKLFPQFTDPAASDDQLIRALQSFTTFSLKSTYNISSDTDPAVPKFLQTTKIVDTTTFQTNWFLFWSQGCSEFGVITQSRQPLIIPSALLESWSVYSQFMDPENYAWWCRETVRNYIKN